MRDGRTAVTWPWAAGMAWIVIAIFSGLFAVLAALTFVGLPVAATIGIGAVAAPVWFAGQLWTWGSAGWALIAGFYGFGLAAWVWTNGPGVPYALVLSVPGVLSLLAAREIANEPP